LVKKRVHAHAPTDALRPPRCEIPCYGDSLGMDTQERCAVPAEIVAACSAHYLLTQLKKKSLLDRKEGTSQSCRAPNLNMGKKRKIDYTSHSTKLNSDCECGDDQAPNRTICTLIQ